MPTTADYLALTDPVLAFASGAYTRFGNLVKYAKWVDLCQCAAAPVTCLGAQFGDGTFGPFGCASTNELLCNTWLMDQDADSPGAFAWNFGSGAFDSFVSIWDASSTTRIGRTRVTFSGNTHAYNTWDTGTLHLLSGHTYQVGVEKVNLSCYAGIAPGTNLTLNPYAHMTGTAYFVGGFTTYPGSSGVGATVGCHPELCSTTTGTIPPDPTPPTPPDGFPSYPSTGSCTTVQDVCDSLAALNARFNDLFAFVKTIQRYRVPFGVVEGTLHTGLSGTGSLSLPGIVGLRVTITTNPPGPVLTGNPPYLWDRGWLSVNDAAGMLAEKRLTRTSFEWFPETPGLITTFQWSLTAGVVIEIQELEPVP